ncbi:MAG: preprotein translocase subunit SecE [Clostridia bacterium]|jgi:preprotein translocase, secE subunit
MAKKNEKNIKDKTSFTKKFKAELKKVIWPTPKQLFNNTVAVLLIVIITAVIVFVLDIAFESMNKYGVNKIKESISNSTLNNTTNETTENAESDQTKASNEETTNTENTVENKASSSENTVEE